VVCQLKAPEKGRRDSMNAVGPIRVSPRNRTAALAAKEVKMNAPLTPPIAPSYRHTPLFPLGADRTAYRRLTTSGVRVERVMGRDMLIVSHEAMRALAETAFVDINHLLRPG